MAYSIIGSKDPTNHSTIYALVQLISEQGIPRKLITDSHSILGAGKKWKQVLGQKCNPLLLSKPDKNNKTPVERAIQNLKFGVGKIRIACGTGILAYAYEMMDYLCGVKDYFPGYKLNNRLPHKVFMRETPDISMFRFKLW